MSETDFRSAVARFDAIRAQQSERRDRLQQFVYRLPIHEIEADRERMRGFGLAGPIRPNPVLKAASDALGGARDVLNKVEAGFKPTNSFIGAGDLVFGEAPRVVEDAAYGFGPVSGSGMTSRLDPAVIDALSLGPDVTDVARLAGKAAIFGALPLARIAPRESGIVSTRVPSAVKATENALDSQLVVDLDSARAGGDSYAKNIELVRSYPNVRADGGDMDATAEQLIEHAKSNLLWLYDQMPADVRTRAAKWYEGANAIAAEYAQRYGLTPQQSSAMIAVLSPQKDWFQNVSLAERSMDILQEQGGTVLLPEMRQAFEARPALAKYAAGLRAMEGRPLSELDQFEAALFIRLYDEAFNPRSYDIITPEGQRIGPQITKSGEEQRVAWGSIGEIGKAVQVYRDGSIDSISRALGEQHKVRNFYNNIFAPDNPEHVTIDTHAVAAALLRPLSGNSLEVGHALGTGSSGSTITGVFGTYPLYAEAYRRAAAEAGVLPRQMQSITWEAVRGLYSDTQKRDKNLLSRVGQVWDNYRQGNLSLEEAREHAAIIAGGIDPPDWIGR